MTIRDLLEAGITIEGRVIVQEWKENEEDFQTLVKSNNFTSYDFIEKVGW